MAGKAGWITIGVTLICVWIADIFGGHLAAWVAGFLGIVILIVVWRRGSEPPQSEPSLFPPLGEAYRIQGTGIGAARQPQSALEAAQLRQLELDTQTKALAQLVCAFAQEAKIKYRKNNLLFPEEDLREVLGPNGDRLHAVMGYLIEVGRASHPDAPPGYWRIDD